MSPRVVPLVDQSLTCQMSVSRSDCLRTQKSDLCREHSRMAAGRQCSSAQPGPDCLSPVADSLAVASGASVKAVQRMLGHASAVMTLDVYAGLFDDELDGVAERMHLAAAREPPTSTVGGRVVGMSESE